MIPNVKRLRAFLVDEKQGIKEYKKIGWNGLAKQEEAHKRFIEMLIKKQRR